MILWLVYRVLREGNDGYTLVFDTKASQWYVAKVTS